MPRAWSTLRSLSAATLPMYSPGLMQDGSSLVIGCTDSSSLVERWDALLSLPSSAHPLANSPPAKKGHAYSVQRLMTLQHQHPTLIGDGPGLILEVDATGVASSGQMPGWLRFQCQQVLTTPSRGHPLPHGGPCQHAQGDQHRARLLLRVRSSKRTLTADRAGHLANPAQHCFS